MPPPTTMATTILFVCRSQNVNLNFKLKMRNERFWVVALRNGDDDDGSVYDDTLSYNYNRARVWLRLLIIEFGVCVCGKLGGKIDVQKLSNFDRASIYNMLVQNNIQR